MRNSSFALQTLLCMSLLAPVAQAQEIAVPDKAQRQGMSYEEYAQFRENMRQHMEKRNTDESKKSRMDAQMNASSSQNKVEMHHHNRVYGRDYESRISEDRAERPQRIERMERGDMGRH